MIKEFHELRNGEYVSCGTVQEYVETGDLETIIPGELYAFGHGKLLQYDARKYQFRVINN